MKAERHTKKIHNEGEKEWSVYYISDMCMSERHIVRVSQAYQC